MRGVLVDTSVWVEALKRPDSSVTKELTKLIDAGVVIVAGVILTELLQGCRIPKERELLDSKLAVFPYIEVTKKIWEKAGILGAQLRAEGKILPLSDLLISSLSIEYDLSVFTLDPHFRHITNLVLHPLP